MKNLLIFIIRQRVQVTKASSREESHPGLQRQMEMENLESVFSCARQGCQIKHLLREDTTHVKNLLTFYKVCTEESSLYWVQIKCFELVPIRKVF